MATQNAFSNIQQTRQQGRWTALRVLQPAGTAVDPGIWYDAQLMHPFTVTIGGVFVATCRVIVSNGVLNGYDGRGDPIIGAPADTDSAWASLGPDQITTPYNVLSDGPYKWLKLVIDAYTSGTIRATWSAAVTVSDKA